MSKDNPKKGSPDPAVPSNLEKDPDDWVTGDERMTDAQASYLKTLCEEAKERFDPSLTKAEASKRIDALQQVTGRGRREEEHDEPAVDVERPRDDDGPEDLDE
jgi:hypothetical protein